MLLTDDELTNGVRCESSLADYSIFIQITDNIRGLLFSVLFVVVFTTCRRNCLDRFRVIRSVFGKKPVTTFVHMFSDSVVIVVINTLFPLG